MFRGVLIILLNYSTSIFMHPVSNSEPPPFWGWITLRIIILDTLSVFLLKLSSDLALDLDADAAKSNVWVGSKEVQFDIFQLNRNKLGLVKGEHGIVFWWCWWWWGWYSKCTTVPSPCQRAIYDEHPNDEFSWKAWIF